ncbi:hypothetical protein TNCV_3982581 [Trichonephila clavipes]|nr:hypothetical protein TNCV_3982581 [Trichonephila clavipes]
MKGWYYGPGWCVGWMLKAAYLSDRYLDCSVKRRGDLGAKCDAFLKAIGIQFSFMDNIRLHGGWLVNEYLQTEGTQRIEWPVRSPDPNSILNA